MRYEYLAGDLILAIIWSFFFFARKDLRKPMMWSGAAYIVLMFVSFAIWKTFGATIRLNPVVPGYWNPPTLFNLGLNTGVF